jgi:hypothetical protein
MPGFLSKASFLLRKDKATVRRWCKRGFIPGAYRTAGGHWRANGFNAKTADAVFRKVKAAGFARKRLPSGSSWASVKLHRKKIAAYRLKRDLYMSEEKLLRREMADFENDYIRRRMAMPGVTAQTAYEPIEFHKLRRQRFPEEQWAAYNKGAAYKSNPTDKIETASGESEFRAQVISCSRKLHLNHKKPTRKNIAREMGIAEITLKRRFKLWRFGMTEVKRHFAEWIGVEPMPS